MDPIQQNGFESQNTSEDYVARCTEVDENENQDFSPHQENGASATKEQQHNHILNPNIEKMSPDCDQIISLAYDKITQFKNLFMKQNHITEPSRKKKYDQFGLSIAEELRALDNKRLASETKLKIRQIMHEAQMKVDESAKIHKSKTVQMSYLNDASIPMVSSSSSINLNERLPDHSNDTPPESVTRTSSQFKERELCTGSTVSQSKRLKVTNQPRVTNSNRRISPSVQAPNSQAMMQTAKVLLPRLKTDQNVVVMLPPVACSTPLTVTRAVTDSTPMPKAGSRSEISNPSPFESSSQDSDFSSPFESVLIKEEFIKHEPDDE